MKMQEFISSSPMLDYHHSLLVNLISRHNWKGLPEYQRIGEIYSFVRDKIHFGYNRSDDLSASEVLQEGYGQCNTKATLLMALLRAVDIPTRLHGFTIYNRLQKGAIPAWLFALAPERILHSWVEVHYQEQWLCLEGFILDEPYLKSVQNMFADREGQFQGYGIATNSLQQPEIYWQGKDTYIQKEGIADDLGVYSSPDAFYAEYGTNLHGWKRFLFQNLVRHIMNFNVEMIRDRRFPGRPTPQMQEKH